MNGIGGRLGPDLSRIGVARARDAIVQQIRGATEDFRHGYEPVTITPTNGQPIHGVKKNEDLFSVQIMDARERIQGYEKDRRARGHRRHEVGDAGVRPRSAERKRPRRSVRYLQTLRGFDPAVK